MVMATRLEFCAVCTTHGYESPVFEPQVNTGKTSVKFCPTCRAAWRWTGREWVLVRESRWSYREFADRIAQQAIIAKIRAELEEETRRVQP